MSEYICVDECVRLHDYLPNFFVSLASSSLTNIYALNGGSFARHSGSSKLCGGDVYLCSCTSSLTNTFL